LRFFRVLNSERFNAQLFHGIAEGSIIAEQKDEETSRRRGFISEFRSFLSDLLGFLGRHQSSPISDRMRLNKHLKREYERSARLKRDRERNERLRRQHQRR
jgi:hypothetical protein